MAKYVAINHDVTINGADFSQSIAAVTFEVTSDEVETTAFQQTWRSRIGGLKDASVSLDFHQDFGAASVDATLYPLLGSVATVVVNPTGSSASSTNPSYTGEFLVTQYTPFASSVGDLATLSVTWPAAGTAGVTRGTGA